jgi:hypothetical protein
MTYIFIFFAQSSHADKDFLTTLIYILLKLTFLTKPLSTMLKLTFLTTPPINPPTLSQLVSKLFSSCFYWFIWTEISFANNVLPLQFSA